MEVAMGEMVTFGVANHPELLNPILNTFGCVWSVHFAVALGQESICLTFHVWFYMYSAFSSERAHGILQHKFQQNLVRKLLLSLNTMCKRTNAIPFRLCGPSNNPPFLVFFADLDLISCQAWVTM